MKQAEDRSKQAESHLDAMEKGMEKANAEAEAADTAMGKAQTDLNKATLLQLKAQTKLIELVRKTQDLHHKELKKAHANATHRVGKVEALLEEKDELLRRGDQKECDELRAKVISAKAKLQAAS